MGVVGGMVWCGVFLLSLSIYVYREEGMAATSMHRVTGTVPVYIRLFFCFCFYFCFFSASYHIMAGLIIIIKCSLADRRNNQYILLLGTRWASLWEMEAWRRIGRCLT